MYYKCQHSFRSNLGRSYYSGKVISHTEYNSLPINEQRWFTRVYDEESVSSDDFITPPSSSSIIDTSGFDSSSDSGSSFDGFGGGESGGGGAGSDF